MGMLGACLIFPGQILPPCAIKCAGNHSFLSLSLLTCHMDCYHTAPHRWQINILWEGRWYESISRSQGTPGRNGPSTFLWEGAFPPQPLDGPGS